MAGFWRHYLRVLRRWWNAEDVYQPRHDGTQDKVGQDYEPRSWKWETSALPAIDEQITNRLIAPVGGLYKITASGELPPRVEFYGLPDTSKPRVPAGAGPSASFFDHWSVPS